MPKGQTSIDIILAILVAVGFFAVLNIHNSNLSAQTYDISVKNGVKSILLDVYSAVGTAKSYEIDMPYSSPRLRIGESSKQLDCAIQFTATGGGKGDLNVISDPYNYGYENVNLEIKLNGTALSGTRTFSCGEQFTIRRG